LAPADAAGARPIDELPDGTMLGKLVGRNRGFSTRQLNCGYALADAEFVAKTACRPTTVTF